jgi:hypothetical protein
MITTFFLATFKDNCFSDCTKCTNIAIAEDSQDLQRGTNKVKEPRETGAFYAKVSYLGSIGYFAHKILPYFYTAACLHREQNYMHSSKGKLIFE